MFQVIIRCITAPGPIQRIITNRRKQHEFDKRMAEMRAVMDKTIADIPNMMRTPEIRCGRELPCLAAKGTLQ